MLPLMRPRDYTKTMLPRYSRVFVGPKLDGVRVQIYQNGIFTRTGERIIGAERYAQAVARAAPSWCVEGEFYHPDLDFDKISGMVRDHEIVAGIKVYLFDIPNLEKRYEERRNYIHLLWSKLPDTLFDYVPDYYVPSTHNQIKSWYGMFLRQGYEGAMIKTSNHFYQDCRPSKRSWDWMRWKPDQSANATIIEIIEGKGKFKNAVGAFRVKDRAGQVFKCGGGKLTHKERFVIFRNPDRYIGRCCEFTFHRRNAAGGYRHPRWRRWRRSAECA